jgi:hypothetical protein
MVKKMLKGKLHIGRPQSSDGRQYMIIEVTDDNSHCEAISLENFTKAITSEYTDCEFDFNSSGVIGKKREWKIVPLTFGELPYEKDLLKNAVLAQVNWEEVDGWKCDWYTVLESRHKFQVNYDKHTTTIQVGFVRYV